MRERLIELIVNADTYDSYECKLCTKDVACNSCYAEKLADHLLANGVIVPPCKVGSEVYYIIDGKIQALRVDYGTFGEIDFTMSARCKDEADMCEAGCWLDGKTCGIGFDYSRIGKTVFLTREEAERALKGGEG